MELKEFQLNAVKSLFEAMDKPVRDIILKSPTGSGKTIILTYFMHQYIQSYPKTVFVWLTPGKGNLEEQSKAKMDKYIHASQTKLLSDVMTAGFEENDSCFINWEKLTKKGNNALKDSERTNFLEHIEHALNDGLRFIIIVDESHQNNTIKADEIIQYFRTEKIIRCSATPKGIAKAEVIEIPEEEVIAAGLIKKMLVINQDFPQTVETEDQTAYLLERALQKQRELRAAYLDKFEASKSLSVKNLIGRAGRSTVDAKFDYGSVVIRNNAITSLRRVMRKAEPLSKISNLDVTDDSLDEKYKEFKEAINTGAFSDEYNLPSADVEKLHSDDVTAMIPQLLDMMFDDGDIISPNTDMKEVNDLFSKLYQQYLGRKLCQAEKSVLSTAVKIMIWKIYGKTFHRICQYRYAYASRTAERQQLYRKRNAEEANSIPAKYIVGYHDIPDKDLTAYPLVSTSIAAKDVDYDLIVYDTYDYLDKLIGFKLSDIFYAIFYQYYEATSDERALRLAKYFKYGTDKEREIWMLRYGFSFEEIEWVSECVDSIDETEIKFNDKINALDDAQLKSIEQYVHE